MKVQQAGAGASPAFRALRTDCGFGSPIMLALLALTVLFSLALADAANVLVSASRARAAADAAALAAAVEQWPFLGAGRDPAGAAERTASANGARIESCDCPPGGARAVVTVTVQTRIRMLRIAPPSIRARADAAVDPAKLFRHGP
ncbi:MAG TPA: pilus assembly protein TadG-related protein [Actinomycetota bacterium]|nr:pilus assembly protein TadG-related protein [Actinomycetota bacterium]